MGQGVVLPSRAAPLRAFCPRRIYIPAPPEGGRRSKFSPPSQDTLAMQQKGAGFLQSERSRVRSRHGGLTIFRIPLQGGGSD